MKKLFVVVLAGLVAFAAFAGGKHINLNLLASYSEAEITAYAM